MLNTFLHKAGVACIIFLTINVSALPLKLCSTGIVYKAGDLCEFNSALFMSLHRNQGSLPIITSTDWLYIDIDTAELWESSREYSLGDVISFDGSLYVASDGNTNNCPVKENSLCESNPLFYSWVKLNVELLKTSTLSLTVFIEATDYAMAETLVFVDGDLKGRTDVNGQFDLVFDAAESNKTFSVRAVNPGLGSVTKEFSIQAGTTYDEKLYLSEVSGSEKHKFTGMPGRWHAGEQVTLSFVDGDGSKARLTRIVEVLARNVLTGDILELTGFFGLTASGDITSIDAFGITNALSGLD